ncbi:hypothetical protein FR932_03515 [Moritella marina ATCC 15381]|uniref:Uncharacterized protein n=1 Tax=Moritella marina ATCC 15381 TaxID=1202962 RepID=A0A5J6WG48_MORMI|nr:hypothetical protein FR932_03515 [Moritella marina ATCC 15381]
MIIHWVDYNKAAYSLCEALAVKGQTDELKQSFFTDINSVNAQLFYPTYSFTKQTINSALIKH